MPANIMGPIERRRPGQAQNTTSTVTLRMCPSKQAIEYSTRRYIVWPGLLPLFHLGLLAGRSVLLNIPTVPADEDTNICMSNGRLLICGSMQRPSNFNLPTHRPNICAPHTRNESGNYSSSLCMSNLGICNI